MLQIKENAVSSTKGIRQLENGDYTISSLVFKVDQLSLYTSTGKEIKLNYQEAILLKMCLEAKDHFLNRKTTLETLWPETTISAEYKKICSRRLNTSINRLKKALSKDKKIFLSCRSKKGYYLMVESEVKIFQVL